MLGPEEEIVRDSAFFQCKVREDGTQVLGSPKCLLGHQIDRGEGNLPDGIFVEWEWRNETFTARNDRYGMYPAFYYSSGSEFSISTSIFKLIELGAPAEINWAGLGTFLRVGTFVGNDTVFSGIQALPPEARLCWSGGRLTIESSQIIRKRESYTRSAAVDCYIDLFRDAIQRRLPDHDDIAMPLSGGRDSRHILFELTRAGRKPRYCVTGRRYPPDRYEDERIASLVAEACGVQHVLVGPPKYQVESYLKANVKTNMTAPRRGWKFSILERLQQDASVSYDGIGGDMLSGGSALKPRRFEAMEAGRYEDFCRILCGGKEQSLREIISAEQADRMTDEVVIERLLGEVVKHADAANPTTSFYFWNRTRRFDSTNPYGMLRDIETVYSPFLDHDLVDFLLSLDRSFNTGSAFHDEAIARAFPEYIDIPYEVQGSPLSRSPVRSLRAASEIARLWRTTHPDKLMRKEFVWPHLAARYATFGQLAAGSWSLPLVTYLMQLEHAASFTD